MYHNTSLLFFAYLFLEPIVTASKDRGELNPIVGLVPGSCSARGWWELGPTGPVLGSWSAGRSGGVLGSRLELVPYS